MKEITFLAILFLTLCTSSCQVKKEPAKEAKPIDIEALEKEGFDQFAKNPKKAIEIFEKVSEEYLKRGNNKKAGFTNLNISSIYDEYLNDFDAALKYADKSLEIWKQEKDTLQQANLYKYCGLLKGKLGKYDLAKADIATAIKLYKQKDFKQGVAVSEFNLSQIYYEENNLALSEKYYLSSIAFWESKNDMDRVFTNNLFGIELYRKQAKEAKANDLIKENEGLAKSLKLNEYLINKFAELKGE